MIAAIRASGWVDLHKLRRRLGEARQARLAGEDESARGFPSLEVGAVPRFGPMVPTAHVLDRTLTEQDRIVCPAGDHHHSLLVNPHEVVRVTAAKSADISKD